MSTSANERKRDNKIVAPKKNPYTITAQSQNSTVNQEPNNITLTTNLDKLQSR